VQVSGGVRVGVQSGAPADPVRAGRLSVRLPEATQGLLCVEVNSVDGRYHAELALRLDGPRTGAHEVVFPTRYAAEIEERASGELAVLAWLGGEECGRPGDEVLLTSWTRPDDSAGYWILVNSGRYRTNLLAFIEGGRERLDCEDLEVAQAVVFDVRCYVPGDIGRNAERIEIRRRRLNSPIRPVPVRILR
jgi:hypothetical protein